MNANRITVRLPDELLAKIKNYIANAPSQGLNVSDIVRQAIDLLPNSPQESAQDQELNRIKPLRRVEINFQLKDEAESLKALQEW
jgi:Arc/MetJ-type ribon-helix-helix transcriptional regulator